MFVTVKELEDSLEFYFEKCLEEDIYITENNRVISVMVSPDKNAKLKEKCNSSIK